MTVVDPWEKVAECERAIQADIDPQQRAILKVLQELWMALANERDVMTDDQVAREAQEIGRLHVELAGAAGQLFH